MKQASRELQKDTQGCQLFWAEVGVNKADVFKPLLFRKQGSPEPTLVPLQNVQAPTFDNTLLRK